MGCLPKGRLRAYLDGEVSADERRAIEEHMTGCESCRRAAHLSETADGVRARLNAMAPQAEPDLGRAWARSQSLRRRGTSAAEGERRAIMNKSLVRRPVFAAGLVLALLVGLMSFGQGRALARQLLSVFRVHNFAVVQVDPGAERLEMLEQQFGEEKLFESSHSQTLVEPTRTVVGSVDEASALAGFTVRYPSYLPDASTSRIAVAGPLEEVLALQGDTLRMLLEFAEMDPSAIPADFVEGEVHAMWDSAAFITGGQVEVAQISNPSATYPDEIDPALFVEAGLRVLGVSPEEAQRVSQHFDWQTTMLVPVLTDAVEFREAEIAGATALFVRSDTDAEYGPSHSTLVMEKDGILYILEGDTSFERLAQVAQSMF